MRYFSTSTPSHQLNKKCLKESPEMKSGRFFFRVLAELKALLKMVRLPRKLLDNNVYKGHKGEGGGARLNGRGKEKTALICNIAGLWDWQNQIRGAAENSQVGQVRRYSAFGCTRSR